MAARKYNTPAAFRQAVDQRLRNDAQEANVTLDHRRQLFVYERFIARLSKVFGDDFIIAGGVALEFLVERARTTKDIDIHLQFRPDSALSKLQEAGNLELGDYLVFEVSDDARSGEAGIAVEGFEHQVSRYRVEVRLGGRLYGHPFHVDLIFIGPPYYSPNEMTGSDFLSFMEAEPVRFQVCPPSIAIGEKLHAYTKPRPSPNSRVRDLPDIGLLARHYQFDCEDLRSTMNLVFSQYNTHAIPDRLPTPPEDWARQYAKLASDNALEWPDLEGLFRAIENFIGPVLAGSSGRWNPDSWDWSL
jgi:hypothetical protein